MLTIEVSGAVDELEESSGEAVDDTPQYVDLRRIRSWPGDSFADFVDVERRQMNVQTDLEVKSELQSGERLIRSGRPRGGVRLVPGDAFLIPFSMLWGAFALYWEYSVIHAGAPLFMALVGMPFVLFGVYLIVGRFFVDAYRRSRTYYGLTDQRILIISTAHGRQVTSLNLSTLAQVDLSERPDRSGTITLGPSVGLYGWLAGSGWPGAGRYASPRLESIENAREVHELILRLQQERAKA